MIYTFQPLMFLCCFRGQSFDFFVTNKFQKLRLHFLALRIVHLWILLTELLAALLQNIYIRGQVLTVNII